MRTECRRVREGCRGWRGGDLPVDEEDDRNHHDTSFTPTPTPEDWREEQVLQHPSPSGVLGPPRGPSIVLEISRTLHHPPT